MLKTGKKLKVPVNYIVQADLINIGYSKVDNPPTAVHNKQISILHKYDYNAWMYGNRKNINLFQFYISTIITVFRYASPPLLDDFNST